MTRALLALALTLTLSSLAAAGGSREQSGPSSIPSVSAPSLGVTGASLSQPSLNTGVALPGAGVGAIPSLPSASAAVGAPAQAAPATPPSGPPSGPSTAAAPPAGPPPGGPGRGPEEGPVPGPAGANEQASENGGPKRAALGQLKAELAALEKEQRGLELSAMRIGVGQKDAPSMDAMQAADGAKRRAEELTPQIQAKRAQVEAAKLEQKAHYDGLRDEISQLKKEKEQALAEAKSAGVVGHEFKGGDGEARARALERAAALDSEIAARKHELSLIERDNPGIAGLRAPLVAAKKALGLAPKTAAEKKLIAEIAELDAAAAEKNARAQSLFKTHTEHPDIGASEEAFKWLAVAKKDFAAADKKRAELAALEAAPAARTPSAEEVRLSGDIVRLDAEQKRLDLMALRILSGQKDSPAASAVEAAHAAQQRAKEMRAELARKREQLRAARPF